MRLRRLLDFPDRTLNGEVLHRLRKANRIALFLDFDGTLARLRPTPSEVRMHAQFRQALYSLAHSPRVFVWIVSGRRRADIRRRVGVPGIRYLGLHGWERRAETRIGHRSQVALDEVGAMARELSRNIRGVWVEDKRYSLAIHHSRENIALVEEAVRWAIQPHHGQVRMASARNVVEVLPLELQDKGSAVKEELRSVCTTAFPIYVGDDLIDEPAFAALHFGLTVLVGKTRRTGAGYRLDNVRDVRRFLNLLEGEFA
jgi:trehalose-phosphatase